MSHCSTQHVTTTQLTLLKLPLDWIYPESSNSLDTVMESILHEGKIKVNHLMSKAAGCSSMSHNERDINTWR